MDFLSLTISDWLNQYGSLALFGLLALGVLALPIPDETLLIAAGVLISKGKLDILPTLLASYAGSMTGITLSYLIGRTAGSYLVHKYGRWIGITETHYQKVHQWFRRFGKWLLLFGYFIAGVRHLTGYAAGTSELDYRQFAIFAYTGAIVWASLFLSLGYFFGNKVMSYLEPLLDKYGVWLVFIAGILLILIYIGFLIYKKYTKKV